MSACPLEVLFPRIAQELVSRWQTPELEPYLDNLIYDPRGGRKGFPLEVMSDLLSLAELHWWMTHKRAGEAAASLEEFSFGGAPKP